MRCRSALITASCLFSIAFARAEDARPVAFVHARILPVSAPEIADGTLIIQGGKIIAIGTSAEIRMPAGAETRDVKGQVIIPGLVDTHSHIGIYPRPSVPAHGDGNEMSGAVQPASSIRCLISGTARAASGMFTVTRTISEPASASSMHC